jgi:hypothetical protein
MVGCALSIEKCVITFRSILHRRMAIFFSVFVVNKIFASCPRKRYWLPNRCQTYFAETNHIPVKLHIQIPQGMLEVGIFCGKRHIIISHKSIIVTI